METQKLELMSEISNLKLKQTSTEKENVELRLVEGRPEVVKGVQ